MTSLHKIIEKTVEKKNLNNNISPEYEGSVYKSQKNFFEGNTDSHINKFNDLLAICIRIAMSLKKMQVKQKEATMMQIKIRVVKRKTFLPTMPR